MKHVNVLALLEAHGATVEPARHAYDRQFVARLNEHKLAWAVDGWTKNVVQVAYTPPWADRGRSWVKTWRKPHNGTKVKEFVQEAPATLWDVLWLGPDATATPRKHGLPWS